MLIHDALDVLRLEVWPQSACEQAGIHISIEGVRKRDMAHMHRTWYATPQGSGTPGETISNPSACIEVHLRYIVRFSILDSPFLTRCYHLHLLGASPISVFKLSVSRSRRARAAWLPLRAKIASYCS